jgi:hypothetical protein
MFLFPDKHLFSVCLAANGRGKRKYANETEETRVSIQVLRQAMKTKCV